MFICNYVERFVEEHTVTTTAKTRQQIFHHMIDHRCDQHNPATNLIEFVNIFDLLEITKFQIWNELTRMYHFHSTALSTVFFLSAVSSCQISMFNARRCDMNWKVFLNGIKNINISVGLSSFWQVRISIRDSKWVCIANRTQTQYSIQYHHYLPVTFSYVRICIRYYTSKTMMKIIWRIVYVLRTKDSAHLNICFWLYWWNFAFPINVFPLRLSHFRLQLCQFGNASSNLISIPTTFGHTKFTCNAKINKRERLMEIENITFNSYIWWI